MRHPGQATRDDVPQIAAALLERLRARSPRVHCITNAVAQNFTANVLLAAGAVPSMTLSAEEIGAFVAGADALLVNLGTFDRERREATGDRGRNRHPGQACPGCSIRCSSTAAPRARPSPARWSRACRRRCGSIAPNLPRCAGSEPTRDALAAYARDTQSRDRAVGRGRSGRRRRAPRGHRQRPSADGQGHRHGLRRLGAGRGLPCGRSRMPGAPPRRRWSSSASPANWRPRRRTGPGSFAVAIIDALLQSR